MVDSFAFGFFTVFGIVQSSSKVLPVCFTVPARCPTPMTRLSCVINSRGSKKVYRIFLKRYTIASELEALIQIMNNVFFSEKDTLLK